MNFKIILYLSLASALLLFSTCEPELELDAVSSGSADFSRYISVGNSLTAGIVSNGLTLESQTNSFPNLLNEQFKLVGGGDFKQPLIPAGPGSGQVQLLSLSFDECGGTSPGTCDPTEDDACLLTDAEQDAWKVNISEQGPFNNLGVQYVQLAVVDDPDWANSSLNPNYYMQRIVSSQNQTYLELIEESVAAIDPTFFTSWLGNSDALLYAATSGGYIALPTCAEIAPIFLGLTDTLLFEENYNRVLDLLVADGRKGAIATVPAIPVLPHFTTITTKQTIPPNCDTPIDLWITTSDGTIRKGKELEDLIPLTSVDYIGRPDEINGEIVPMGLSEANPLCNSYVLDKDEVQKCVEHIDAYNRIIKRLGAERNLLVIDMAAYLDEIDQGIGIQGIDISSGFISGGGFSMDGIHPCDRGYAIVANKFIEEMNTAYGANIPQIDITQFPCVVLP